MCAERFAVWQRGNVVWVGDVAHVLNLGWVSWLAGGWMAGLPYRPPGLLSSEPGVPSPLVTGKRSLTGGSGANSLPGHGSIPVKRARSSAANLRPRGTQPGASPGNSGCFRSRGRIVEVVDCGGLGRALRETVSQCEM